MSWWGKMMGGAVGFMFGGPLGAMFGAAIGHNFDRGVERLTTSDERERETSAEQAFFTAAFTTMGAVCKADGRVSEAELDAARAVMTHLRLDGEQRRAAMRLFTEGKRPDFPLVDVLDGFQLACLHRNDLLRLFLEIQVGAAWAEGEPHPQQRALLADIFNRLGIPRFQLDAMEQLIRLQRGGAQSGGGYEHSRRGSARPHPPTLTQDYATLGIDSSVSDDELTRAYRRLLSRHHPDKLSASGASEAELKRAAERTHAIRSAYERIRVARGLD
ncbi:co-chaperone DjlA [Plasticicumulans acidivorans]|uniref:DnaJ like chaperone protein n=1 Tax=Plasticicumulans acidivorans TaxID=886464 RepID=A0A317MYN6_9GAMM|nr:co-chaperone DjlA [Plasticicumulans acidivorans]PWV64644.1 DnaJ like chaperone protein [Plasticicumulans acidivorans]